MTGELITIAGNNWENECNEAARWWNTERPLARSLDLIEEGIAMEATRTCSTDACVRPIRAREMCSKHYLRWWYARKNPPQTKPSVEDRFWSKVNRTESCWLWIGSTSTKGYGNFYPTSDLIVPAYRYAYELIVGPIPTGLHIDHLCRNPTCVNPAHLEPVTPAENTRRGLKGVLHTHCKQGHEMTPGNTYTAPRGSHECRTCRSANRRKRWLASKDATSR